MKRILLCLLSLFAACLSLPLAAQNIFLKVGGGLATHYGHARAVGAYKIGVGYIDIHGAGAGAVAALDAAVVGFWLHGDAAVCPVGEIARNGFVL